MHTEINIRRSHYYVNSFQNTFTYGTIATLYSEITFAHLENIFYIYMERTEFQPSSGMTG